MEERPTTISQTRGWTEDGWMDLASWTASKYVWWWMGGIPWSQCISVSIIIEWPHKIITCHLGDCVQWFHAQADMEHWQEEVEILEEEFRWAIHGFEKMEQVWSSLAMSKGSESADFDPRVTKGKMAYRKKKAAMYIWQDGKGGSHGISFDWGYLFPRRHFIGRSYSISVAKSGNWLGLCSVNCSCDVLNTIVVQ